ncbi:MAG: 50S ribosomal protein L32 [Candidatus Levyibacteriota bacterium]
MSQEPKKRHSRARQGKRRASISLSVTRSVVCPNCGAPQISHRVCEACGFYKGQQVIKVKQANADAPANS